MTIVHSRANVEKHHPPSARTANDPILGPCYRTWLGMNVGHARASNPTSIGDNFNVYVDNIEVPILDGSAIEFIKKIVLNKIKLIIYVVNQ